MKSILLLIGGIFVMGLAAIAVVVVFYVSTYNKEVLLRNKAEAQWKVCQASHDTMWKIISQKAQVSDKYKEVFKEVYPQIIKSRYEDGQKLLAKFVTEANPNFDISLMKDLMQSIEAERKSFFNEQKKMQDIQREYNSLLEGFFSQFVLSKPKMNYPVITSDRTSEAFDKGKDNDVSVFK